MGFVNKVMLMGNTTRDPELRTLPSGTTVCDFALATNRVYKTTGGEEKQETVFIDCTAFGRTAEVIAEYCPKGRSLFVEGRLHYQTWEDKAGSRRSKLSVIVEGFQFVGSREGGGGGGTQRELPLEENVRRMDERPPMKVPAIGAAGASAQRRGTQPGPVAGGLRREGGERFANGQRPEQSPEAAAAARTARKQAGKPARAAVAVGPITHGGGTATVDIKAVDQMADEAQAVEDADLPF